MERDAHAKTRFCMRRMGLAAWLADGLESPEQARACARGAFLYLDGFLKTAPQVRNAHKGHPNAREAKTALARLRDDYDNFYDRIRDELTGHQLALGPLGAALLFNEVDQAAVSLLVEDAKQVAVLLAAMDPAVREPLESPDTTDGRVGELLSKIRLSEHGAAIRMDRLALNNPNTVGAIPLHPLQEAGQTLLSCHELFGIDYELCEGLPASSEAASLLSVLALLDVTNLVDALFGRDVKGTHEPGFVDHARTAELSNASSFALLRGRPSVARIEMLRERRNHVAGHVEQTWTLFEVKQEERRIRIRELKQLADELTAEFLRLCRQDIRSQMFGIHGQRASFVVGVEPTDLVRPYHASSPA